MKIRKFAGSSSSGARRTASTATCRRLHTVATRWLFREEETVQAAQTVQIVQAPSFILPRVGDCVVIEKKCITVILINMKAMYFAASVDRLTGEGGRTIWNTSQWTYIRSIPGRE